MPRRRACWPVRQATLGAWLVHYSTDYVFDGSGNTPRDEAAATGPLSVYGRTKLDGESHIRASGCRHLILRTSWVYAARGGNFARTMVKLAAERDALSVIDDQIGAPTGADLLADITAPRDPTPCSGTAAVERHLPRSCGRRDQLAWLMRASSSTGHACMDCPSEWRPTRSRPYRPAPTDARAAAAELALGHREIATQLRGEPAALQTGVERMLAEAYQK